MERECGFLVCETRSGRRIRGPSACGSASNVTIPVRCPPGSRPVALTHNHPSGNPLLSELDKSTARRFNIAVCTKTRNYGTRCYRVRRK